jgi:hypothetical protein
VLLHSSIHPQQPDFAPLNPQTVNHSSSSTTANQIMAASMKATQLLNLTRAAARPMAAAANVQRAAAAPLRVARPARCVVVRAAADGVRALFLPASVCALITDTQ